MMRVLWRGLYGLIIGGIMGGWLVLLLSPFIEGNAVLVVGGLCALVGMVVGINKRHRPIGVITEDESSGQAL